MCHLCCLHCISIDPMCKAPQNKWQIIPAMLALEEIAMGLHKGSYFLVLNHGSLRKPGAHRCHRPPPTGCPPHRRSAPQRHPRCLWRGPPSHKRRGGPGMQKNWQLWPGTKMLLAHFCCFWMAMVCIGFAKIWGTQHVCSPPPAGESLWFLMVPFLSLKQWDWTHLGISPQAWEICSTINSFCERKCMSLGNMEQDFQEANIANDNPTNDKNANRKNKVEGTPR